MRWQRRSVKNGDTRTKTFFAWLPVTSQKTRETRWMEKVTVLQRYSYGLCGATEPRMVAYWKTVEFVD